MGQSIVQVDAFTDRPYSGNPAAVCVLETTAPDEWMKSVAREMNLSETAFLVPEADGFRLRWFTPAVEVDLCGHATLASAHVLWETGRLAPTATARFLTRSGLLTARRDGDWIEMDFPAETPVVAEAPAGLIEALGVEPVHVARNRFDYLVEVADEATVRGCSPDFTRLRSVEARGVIVTSAAGGAGYDFVSRFFAPRAGVDEDPVTGSAHCCLAPWWSARFERDALTGHQASRRGGTVHVRLNGSRVLLRGMAVTVLRGELADAALPAE
jgi:PhzF family phenazine biosynthesis protein